MSYARTIKSVLFVTCPDKLCAGHVQKGLVKKEGKVHATMQNQEQKVL